MSENFNDINNELLVNYLLGETTANEKLLVEKWLGKDPANRNYFEGFKLIWDESKKLSVSIPVNEDEAWKRFQNRVQSHVKEEAVIRPIRQNLRWMRVAAIFFVLVSATALIYFLKPTKPAETLHVQTRTEILNDTLPDGSTVTLNKNSFIAYPNRFTGDTRAITLKGEAFFNIIPDKNKPFIIRVNDLTVKVVGTSFNIKEHNGVTEVIVETGIVQVFRDNDSVELKTQEKLVLHNQDSAFSKEQVTDRLYDYYRSKEFVCDNTPLWKLVEVLNQAYNANIIIERKSLRALPLNTTFNNESLDHILEIVSETFNITVTKKGDQIILE